MDIGPTLVRAALGSESGTSTGAGSGERGGGQVQEGENKANRGVKSQRDYRDCLEVRVDWGADRRAKGKADR